MPKRMAAALAVTALLVTAQIAASAPSAPMAAASHTTQQAAAPASVRTAILPPRWRGRNVTRLPTKRRVVALTIDCGSGNGAARSMMRTLREKNAEATFFVTGAFARNYPGDVRRMAKAGHTVGNHSDTHPDFRNLSTQQQTKQIKRAGSRITALTGFTPRPWFRFPYGGFSQSSIKLANKHGYAAVGWTVDTLGWLGTSGGQSAQSVIRRVTAAARPGEIVLMHCGANPTDGSKLDAKALPTIIDRLRAKGYEFVRLGDSPPRY
ncbi:MAG: polysaccharide deacetylase family protein [Candidatus Nanopelagicales bacterium]|nr:polysaccharide deacetylase family protein [Candidatus Nanopelagicales bacterium]MDZ4250444.1 polysaccharide deacetylase family protein [Candidatus Nanopelagicales bacterium]MDZ7578333.1 polysaccharide deacetylase family protein [Candidatus Nanopelagicales bacterium]